MLLVGSILLDVWIALNAIGLARSKSCEHHSMILPPTDDVELRTHNVPTHLPTQLCHSGGLSEFEDLLQIPSCE
jgi:hypothetical protein